MGALYKYTCVMLVLISEFLVFAVGAGNIKEYCLSQTFNPTCETNEIIIIEQAQFGRMNIGQCVKIGDNIGCSSDVKQFLDSRCSGKRSCSLHVAEINDHVQLNCLREMNPYLEASYVCLNVFTPEVSKCISPVSIEATNRPQYISSLISHETSCGLHQTPYIIDANPGQEIQLTLHDYNYGHVRQEQPCANKYGYILDGQSNDVINLCGGLTQSSKIYTSAANNVQVLLEKATIASKQFTIEFQAVGCPDKKAPPHTWMKKTNKTLSFGCHTSPITWAMRCIGNIWLGVMRKCSPPSVDMVNLVEEDTEEEVMETKGNSEGIPHVSNNHLFAICIGCVTLIICCTTVVLGIHCVKRYELSLEKKNAYNMNSVNFNSVYKPVTTGTMPLIDQNTGELLHFTLNSDNNFRILAPTADQNLTSESTNMDALNYHNMINSTTSTQRHHVGHDNDEIYHSIHGRNDFCRK